MLRRQALRRKRKNQDGDEGEDEMAVPERVIEFILVAEFDLTEGSTLAIEFPNPTGLSHDKLAELMLPDGAHNRDEDWTTFFINKKLEDETARSVATSAGTADDNKKADVLISLVYELVDEEWVELPEGRCLLWLEDNCIHVTRTDLKRIVCVRGGEELQLVTLEPSFVVAVSDELCVAFRFALLTDAARFITHCRKITSLPRATDEDIGPSDDEDEEGDSPTEAAKADDDEVPLPNFMYGLNLVRTKRNDKWVRGAKVKAMAFCMQHQWIHALKPLLILALEDIFEHPDDDIYAITVVTNLYEAINSMDLSEMPVLTEGQKVLRRTVGDMSSNTFVSSVRYSASDAVPLMTIPVRVPLTMMPDQVGDQSNLIPLVTKFGHEVFVIFNAILMEKRIVFLNYGRPANEVCNYVLAAMEMLCPPLRGLVLRSFPYVNLVNMQFMNVHGFIAGTTNRLFRDREEWWDVLCDIDSGEIALSSKSVLDLRELLNSVADQDGMVYSQIQTAIDNYSGEGTVRNIFQSYATHIIDMARNEEEFVSVAEGVKQTTANAQRIEQVRRTVSFKTLMTRLTQERSMSAIRNHRVIRHVRKLSIRRDLTDKDIFNVYTDFVDNIVTEEQILEFLTYLSGCGLFPIAMPVFHPSVHIRCMVVELLNRLSTTEPGSALISNLNAMVLSAYDRNKFLVQ